MAAETAQNWTVLVGHACLWGSLALAAAGMVCRCLPRLPAAVRAWLWWLASAKLLLGLCVAAPISLPILPVPLAARSVPAPAAPPKLTASHPLPRRVSPAALPALPSEADAPPAPAAPAPCWPVLLLGAWALGVAASSGLIVRQSLALRRLRRDASPAALPGLDWEALARQMGLHRAPRVFSGPCVPTPCVAGIFRPVILLPPGFRDSLTPAELRLTLAHEMAHLKRGDLVFALVPLLARTVFFFNPLAWWAAAEWAAAREEACDALALSATGLPAADYGRLLLKFASPALSPPALGLSPGFLGLRRRLVSLRHARPVPRRMRLLALFLPLLLPWRLSAALPPSAASSSLSHAPAGYTVTTLTDDDGGEVSALNNAGQVALSVRSDGGAAQGYAGSPGDFAVLPALPKHRSSAVYGLNGVGQAAGASFNIPGHARAFVWDGATHKLGSLPGFPYSEARGVSEAGAVAGFAETGHADRRRAWITRAFVRQADGSPARPRHARRLVQRGVCRQCCRHGRRQGRHRSVRRDPCVCLDRAGRHDRPRHARRRKQRGLCRQRHRRHRRSVGNGRRRNPPCVFVCRRRDARLSPPARPDIKRRVCRQRRRGSRRGLAIGRRQAGDALAEWAAVRPQRPAAPALRLDFDRSPRRQRSRPNRWPGFQKWQALRVPADAALERKENEHDNRCCRFMPAFLHFLRFSPNKFSPNKLYAD